jgi:hypothetical protein
MFGHPGRRPVNNLPSTSNKKNTTKATAPKLYRPSVYSYICHGYYFAASDQAESSAGPGACRGITSQLEILENQGLMTRAEALKRFSTMSEDVTPEDEEGGDLQQQAIYMSPVLVFQNKSLTDASKQERLPTEELIKRETYEGYGSTEVEYLMLEDTTEPKQKHFVAVGPRNTGVSFRQIDTEDSVRQITRIGLGFIQIIFDSNTTIDDASSQVPSATAAHHPEQRPPTMTLDHNKERLLQFWGFCTKVAEHTQMNAEWLADNLQDDFPRRTYQAGTRIIAELPRICQKTAANMGKIIRRMISDDYEEE